METTVTLSVKEILNHQIANYNVLYTKLHQFHWYVKGPHFFTLHEKFEELYNEAAEAFDELAERLLSIGGKPFSTLSEYLANTSLVESTNVDRQSGEFVQELVENYEAIRNELIQAITVAGDEGDDVTEDLFIGLKANIDKHIWMLKAYLG
ncbi:MULTISPECIES: Dps family protein [Bacillus]|uniref:General stress protein n=2 Tax=Bacillus TaxID=1386 RepID=A0A0M3R8U6_9BACI|nr:MULTISPECIES: DNA starvation/stationary phase protection protein [Bacillus]ALC80296.1 general stress protein [Bacillus gobiensis]MBP1083871.1 starvation-inducible DNA-binding protein [Bacillus capparidis]MED1098352.1 DNA starvation/stationary phase protection protein [Bacillus capparidis]